MLWPAKRVASYTAYVSTFHTLQYIKVESAIPEVVRQTTRLWSIKETCLRLRIRKICLVFSPLISSSASYFHTSCGGGRALRRGEQGGSRRAS